MKVAICDRCGAVGRASRHEEGPRVIEVRAGVQNGGRVLDLCGDCRKDFAALISGWIQPHPGCRCGGNCPVPHICMVDA